MTLTKDIQYYASRARRFVEPLPRNSSMLFPPQRNALFLVQTLTKLPQRTTMVSARTPPPSGLSINGNGGSYRHGRACDFLEKDAAKSRYRFVRDRSPSVLFLSCTQNTLVQNQSHCRLSYIISRLSGSSKTSISSLEETRRV
jgi:hypothetical protein